MELSDSDLLNSIRPIFWFHRKEAFFPQEVEKMIQSAEVWTPTEKVLSLQEEKEPVQRLLRYSNGYSLKHTELEGSLDAPVYARVDRRDPQFIRVVFFLIFPFNGNLNVCGTPSCGCISAGAHQGDLERVTFLLDPTTYKISKVYFGAHGSKDGLWLNGEDIEYQDESPVIYVAWNSHALYPHAKTWFRYFGTVNDYTEKGQLWIPRIIQIEEEIPEWQKIKVHLGWPDHSNFPAFHSAWNEDPPVSTSWWKRFFGCC